ncbi:glycosyltransferase family 2 protein [Antrihabitans cavernicola]|uniref:Glycosyltransferase family 2 protein n=1 Tax=Antrihabitans cavernicola TaxID=2495913 RepID=A0A5A7SJL3_9NOCA|nr:glycosyltransferase family A protein [Spelaeibacter cavernicola]KAA0024615.1 glycosyltransferase family 2 protein [Spelaeibacter cavernicola]
MSPRVSVVVPAYNNADYIAETIESILAQTYDDFEVIIGDHTSDDATLDVVQRYADDPRITVITTEAGGGAKRNWDRVSRAASGELLKLVCGDDIIYPTALAEQVAAFDEHPSAVLVASQRKLVDAKGGTVIKARGLGGLSGLVSGRVAARSAVIAGANIFGEPACVMMKRSDLAAVGWWDDTHPYLIDEATYVDVALRGDFVAIPKALAAFRINAGQWSVRLATQQAVQAAAFHKKLRDADPTLLSKWDVRLGDAKALATSFMRRAVYILLSHRMK